MNELVDLSLSLTPGMRGVTVRPAYTVEKEGWNAADWSLYSHAGTHVDAPIHFDASDLTIDKMPLERFCGPAWIAHLQDVEPRQLIRPADLGAIEETIEPGGCLLLHTGWSAHVDTPSIYRDAMPRISEELANWCVRRGIKLLGVEPPSVADVNNLEEVTRIHKILLGANITIVEGLCNLHLLGLRAYFMALPLKLAGGDGCPVRAIAIRNGLSKIFP